MKKFSKQVKVLFNVNDYLALTSFANKCGVTRAFIVRVATRRYLLQKGVYQDVKNHQETSKENLQK